MSKETNEFPSESEIDEDGHVTGLIEGYALRALDPDEMAVVEAHLPHCRRCQARLAEYERVVSMLAYASPVEQVPVRSRAELLRRVDQIGTANRGQMIPLPRAARTDRGRFRLPALPQMQIPLPRVAAFAAVLVLIAVATVAVMGSIINNQQQQIAEIQEKRGEEIRVLAGSADPTAQPASDSRFVTSQPASDAKGRLIINWDTNQMMIAVIDLASLDEGQQYVAWLRIRGSEEYSSEGPLEVDDQHRATLVVEPVDSIANYEEVMVTIETDPNATFPAGPAVMTAGIAPPR